MSARRFLPDYSLETIAQKQLKGLRWTVGHVLQGSPFYQERLKAAGLRDSKDITSLRDLTDLPLTTAGDLKDGYPLPLLSVPQNKIVCVHASSGTTGKRKVLAYTRKDVDTFSHMMARCFELAGVTPEDRMQIAVGYGLWTAGVGFQLGC